METPPLTPEQKTLEQSVKALIEIYHLLKVHPTNAQKLAYGQPGYCSATRYAFLVAQDTLLALGKLP